MRVKRMCIRGKTVCNYKKTIAGREWVDTHYSDVSILRYINTDYSDVSILRRFILFADWHHVYTC
jgi:ribosomal protein S18